MTRRLWYPQLDVYDAIRRLASLLAFWDVNSPPSQERLYIADFYLANPPLLHKTHMLRDIRSEFSALGVKRPEKAFISYPSAPVLFQKMDEVQKQAFRTLTGKGLINAVQLEQGAVVPTEAGHAVFNDHFVPLLAEGERALAKFIAGTFARVGSQDIAALRRNTGLRRVGR
jgi:hypothetical protein